MLSEELRAFFFLVDPLEFEVLASHPVQPVKVDSVPGVGVSVIGVPGRKLAEHVVPQEIPAGDDTTVPVPLPDLVTERTGL